MLTSSTFWPWRKWKFAWTQGSASLKSKCTMRLIGTNTRLLRNNGLVSRRYFLWLSFPSTKVVGPSSPVSLTMRRMYSWLICCYRSLVDEKHFDADRSGLSPDKVASSSLSLGQYWVFVQPIVEFGG